MRGTNIVCGTREERGEGKGNQGGHREVRETRVRGTREDTEVREIRVRGTREDTEAQESTIRRRKKKQ